MSKDVLLHKLTVIAPAAPLYEYHTSAEALLPESVAPLAVEPVITSPQSTAIASTQSSFVGGQK